MEKKKIAVFTGAGISAESGIATFRGDNGLWENHRIEDVASPEGWRKNKNLVLDFYNQRRRQLLQCEPNLAHYALAKLEEKHEVIIITQNVDDLHERAGSSNVLHLHGELLKARSEADEHLILDWLKDICPTDRAPDGAFLRPHIVWFGEAVPMIERAIPIVANCDVFIIVGTSLAVYPAAGLINYAKFETPKWLIDPNDMVVPRIPNLNFIQSPATIGVSEVVQKLMS